ncbi:unnamed protein product [Ectocarpus sp. CCAP 1310/34]|nr:unnamed protein product [Ectocarpus sp. CCAP 1310/34]
MLQTVRALRRGGAPAGARWLFERCALVRASSWETDGSRHQRRRQSTVDSKVQAEILEKCDDLHASFIQPLNDKTAGPLEKLQTGGYQSTKMPFVFVLGNHSSGKSSFINYVLGRNIQTAGVAPTDDSFTIIAPGPSDLDQDGPALVGDPDMGFSGLRQFGPTLTHHTELKVRSGISTNSFMMVDSPGMIDSPMSRSIYERSDPDSPAGRGKGVDTSRGYDFEGVVRWFAERADVILLFFDPDKPGTTGETLSILTNSLAGKDHKLYVVLNKADQFKKIHDFARAYGSLCWNLSKVIPRKDLPRIYTMCLPVKSRDGGAGEGEVELSLSSGLHDLEATRDDVAAEVMKAPKRRIDNIITRLTDSVHLLQVHTTVLDALQKDFRNAKLVRHGTTFAVLAAGGGLFGGSVFLGAPIEMAVGAAGLALASAGGLQFHNSKALKATHEEMISVEGLNHYFGKIYTREVSEGDESITASWRRIRHGLHLTLASLGIDGVSRVKASEQRELQKILDTDIPSLRRQAAPVRFSFFGTKSRQ